MPKWYSGEDIKTHFKRKRTLNKTRLAKNIAAG